jgi:hypothetical protein
VTTELPQYLLLSNTTTPGRAIEIVDVIGIIDTDGDGRTPAGIALDRDDTLECLMASVLAHPWVRSEREPVVQQLGVMSGWFADVSLDVPDDSRWAGAPAVPMFNLTREPGAFDRLGLALEPQRTVLFRATDEGAAPYLLITAYGEDAAGFDAFAPFAQQVIDSIQVDTSSLRTEFPTS